MASPLETLYLNKGDCEDVAILHYSLCKAFGFDTKILVSENHVRCGVRVDSWLPKTSEGYVIFECTSALALPLGYQLWQGSAVGETTAYSSDISTLESLEKMLIVYCQRLGWFYPNLFG